MNSVPCMGGWCSVRQSCRHYHADSWTQPAEHLCTRGSHDCWAPITAEPEHIAHHHLLAVCQGTATERTGCA